VTLRSSLQCLNYRGMGISPHCSCGPPYNTWSRSLGTFGASVSSPHYFFLSSTTARQSKSWNVFKYDPIAWLTLTFTLRLVGPTVFREPRNFELSRGIWNFRVSVEFHGIPRKHGNSAATAKFRKSVLLW